MVDGDVAGDAVCCAVEGACPGARGWVAVAADLDVVAVTAEDVFTRDWSGSCAIPANKGARWIWEMRDVVGRTEHCS